MQSQKGVMGKNLILGLIMVLIVLGVAAILSLPPNVSAVQKEVLMLLALILFVAVAASLMKFKR